jgi:hypothetical protein
VVRRALGIAELDHRPFTAIKFDCGCGNGPEYAWRKLLENSVLILLALWLLAGRGRQFCARYSFLSRRETPQNESPVAGNVAA